MRWCTCESNTGDVLYARTLCNYVYYVGKSVFNGGVNMLARQQDGMPGSVGKAPILGICNALLR